MLGVKSPSGVAAFFDDKRVQSALTGPRSAASPSLLDEFFSRYGYTDCSADQLLSLADLATRCRRADVSAEALRQVIASGAKLHLAHYRLGRLLLSQGDPAEAAAQFDLGAAANPGFAFNHMGGARARAALGTKQEALPYAERFVAFNVRPHGSEDVAVLADLADLLFDTGHRDRAAPIYALLQQFGAQASRHAVRLVEAQIAANDYASAGALLREHVARNGLDPWANRALALCLSHEGDHHAAMSHARQALQSEPANPGYLGTFIRVLGKSGDAAAIRDAITAHAAIMAQTDIVELTARLHLAEGDTAAAVDTVMASDPAPDSRLHHVAVETAYAAMGAGNIEAATSLAEKLQALAPEDTVCKVLRIDLLFRQMRWEEAGDVLATIPPSENERPQVTMKRLEQACFSADRETADAAALRLETLVGGNRQFMLPLLRYHAEQQNWDGVVDRALGWLDGALNYDQIGYVLFRAAKYTGRQAEMVTAILAIPGWNGSAGLLRLRNALVCDQVRNVADADALLADPALAGNAVMLEKLTLQRGVLAKAERAATRDAVFLCTDANYLCATIVTLHGLSRTAANHRLDFFIVCDDDVADLAKSAASAFNNAGISVTVFPASRIVGSAERLFPDYGLFTSGHKLASAAYYRIYFAKYLQHLGQHVRALYVDSDVLLTGSLDALLELDLAGKPLTARLETPRPEVDRAIAHHNLTAGQYFNSGVLLVDLCHPELEAGLDAAVSAIADANVRLLYHDQCALNLGFRDNFAALDEIWNYPVQDRTKSAQIPANASLLHFLYRPKPWSAAYNGDAGPLWFTKYRDAAAFIGEDLAASLYRLIQD